MKCECGKIMKYTGNAVWTDPLQYEYKCDKCEKVIVNEEVPPEVKK